MNKDTIAGAVKKKGGELRAKIDHKTGDTKGEAQGRMDQAAGKVQKNIGKLKDAID